MDGVIKSRNGHLEVVGKILFPHQFHSLNCLGPERGVGLVSGGIVVKLKHIGSAKGLPVKKLEGCFNPRIIDYSGARVRSTAKGRIMIVPKPQIQYEVLSKVNFVLSISRKYA